MNTSIIFGAGKFPVLIGVLIATFALIVGFVVPAANAASAPTNVRLVYAKDTSIRVAWDYVSGTNKKNGYKVYKNGTFVGTSTNNQETISGLSKCTLYQVVVSAMFGTTEYKSAPVEFKTTGSCPVPVDSTPKNVRPDPAYTADTTSFRAIWDAVSGYTGNYKHYLNNTYVDGADDTSTGETFSGLAPGTSYSVQVSTTVGGVEYKSAAVVFTTASSPPPPPAPTTGVPVAGNWTQTFSDEFSGTAVDTSKWRTNWYGEGGEMNKVGTYSRNATVANGELRLVLESSTAGALIHTDFAGGQKFAVGDYVEARIFFPGSADGCNAYNWPAWWVSSDLANKWPNSGEHDIAEVLGVGGLGKVTVNYHSPSGAFNQGEPKNAAGVGCWANAWHTYGIHRKAASADVYYDGRLVKSYATSDNNQPEILILNHGKSDSRGYFTGEQNSVRVDYVRAYAPSP